ncbi:MAG: undecaprenyldiphospho-muramoylpentapeptide beta-N-acetylglucosaminyltransferase, partial [Bacteroidota bacterium]
MKVIISGGGSGGHVYPAIAIADGIKAAKPDAEILFVGAKGKIEMEKVPKAGYSIKALNIRGFDRQRKFRNITLPFNLLSSLVKASSILKRFKPDVAIGVGGYASGPLIYTAARKGIPTLLQEQNSYPGITNKLLSKRANTICVAYDGMDRFFKAEKIVLTGNPVRNDIADLKDQKAKALSYFGLKDKKPIIFAFGGSLGARTINESFSQQVELLKTMDAQLLWQTGKSYYDQMKETAAAHLPNVKVHQFIDRMDLAYALADLIIGRAGALTISELSMVGKAAILVPSPNVAEDHQTKNAQALSSKAAAVLVKDREAKATLLPTALDLLKDKDRRQQLGTNLKTLAQPDATRKIVEEVLKLVE